MCKAVLFDFNGTLFQDSPLHEKAWLTYAKEEAGKLLTPDEFQKNVHGRNNRLILEYLFERDFTLEEAIEYGERKEEIYRQMVRNKPDCAFLTPGATEFLDHLKTLGIPRNIASASGKGNMDFYFELFDLERWFDYEKIIYDNGKRKSKPDPEYYLQAAQNIEISPADAVIFEDSPSGLLAGKKAGARKLFAIITENNEEDLRKLQLADEVVADYQDERVVKLFS
ncbi:HAD family phosphatase [Enterococcus asini]|uniref:HAD family hydrolase n=1 Tax=Enterococcus TaxID=1350 RepID=UPI002890B3B4|nr:HAD family phosphatase [Enterococcus asini]MDT2756090.1 HAD family phosphatase [Enterococcus asini]